MVLKVGMMNNRDVEAWQTWLDRNGYSCGQIDGDFGKKTQGATLGFQFAHKECGIPNGELNDTTLAVATALGFRLPSAQQLVTQPPVAVAGSAWRYPEPPACGMLSATRRKEVFGSFKWSPYPAADSSGQSVEILGGWEEANIVNLYVPQLEGMPWFDEGGKPCNGHLRIHRLLVPHVLEAYAEVERRGYLGDLLTVDGGFNARYMRRSRTSLSNHSYGTAIDHNCNWNQMGKTPAKPGRDGCMWRVASVFIELGWYWGGHFSCGDGMHLEWADVSRLKKT